MHINVPDNRENRLLYTLLFISVLLLMAYIFPMLWNGYNEKKGEVLLLKNKLFFQEKILSKRGKIKQAYEELPAREERYKNKLFIGSTPDIVNSVMRSELTRIARMNNVSIVSLNLPKFSVSGQWVLVTQSVVFDATAQYLLSFIDSLRMSDFFLPVISIDLRLSGKENIRCSMKIVGFSHFAEGQLSLIE